jgi:hypothetical protein
MTRKTVARRRRKRVDYKAACGKLAGCVLFALQNRKHLSHGTGVLVHLKTRKITGERWEDKFFDALEAAGLVYDREAYYASSAGKRRAVSGF